MIALWKPNVRWLSRPQGFRNRLVELTARALAGRAARGQSREYVSESGLLGSKAIKCPRCLTASPVRTTEEDDAYGPGQAHLRGCAKTAGDTESGGVAY